MSKNTESSTGIRESGGYILELMPVSQLRNVLIKTIVYKLALCRYIKFGRYNTCCEYQPD